MLPAAGSCGRFSVRKGKDAGDKGTERKEKKERSPTTTARVVAARIYQRS
jgi:hypothetical protein